MSNDGLHNCPWPGCSQRVPRHLWGCKAHWYRVPRELRNQCTSAWRSGSLGEHMEALEAIDDWLEGSPA